jgi:hypothetical protein
MSEETKNMEDIQIVDFDNVGKAKKKKKGTKKTKTGISLSLANLFNRASSYKD